MANPSDRRRPASTTGHVFTTRTRRAAWAYVAAGTVASLVLGGGAEGPREYLSDWVLVSALNIAPALVATAVVSRRQPGGPDAPLLRQTLLGFVLCHFVGVGLMAWVVTGAVLPLYAAGALGFAAKISIGMAFGTSLRIRAGTPVRIVDVVGASMVVLGVTALAVPILAPLVVNEEPWFTVPALVTASTVLGALIWVAVLSRRLDGPGRSFAGVGLLAGVAALVSSWAQVAQGFAGFTLPSGPLLAAQSLATGLMLLSVLHRSTTPFASLDRARPPKASRWAASSIRAAGVLTALLVVGVLLTDRPDPWLVPFAGAVVVLQLAFLVVRSRLREVELRVRFREANRTAEERRSLLSAVLAGADQDRHRMVAGLHEQALSSYVAFASYLRTVDLPPEHAASSSLAAVREELAARATTLAELTEAIRPASGGDTDGERRFAAAVLAYVDSFWGDAPAPFATIAFEEGLELDWCTETVALRIVQEALRNVQQHAGAAAVRVGVRLEGDDAIVLTVDDDGCGPGPRAALEGSGLATMRALAGLRGGRVELRPHGSGSRLFALLGAGPAADRPAHREAATLDLVRTDAWTDEAPATAPRAHLHVVPT